MRTWFGWLRLRWPGRGGGTQRLLPPGPLDLNTPALEPARDATTAEVVLVPESAVQVFPPESVPEPAVLEATLPIELPPAPETMLLEPARESAAKLPITPELSSALPGEAAPPVELPPAQEAPLLEPVQEPGTALPAAAESPSAVQMQTRPPAVPADDWMRSRALYFSPTRYAPGTRATERLLAPDLLFRLGVEQRRAIGGSEPSRAQPDAVARPVIARPEPRLMEEFATATGTTPSPEDDPPGKVLSVDPLLLTLFLSTREGGPDVPSQATADYLTTPALLERGIALRDRVLRHWSAGGAPLGVQQFYDLALQIAQHPGTALLLCHNTAKAFARGGEAIRWHMVNRTRAEYSDGEATHAAAALHRGGILRSGPLAQPSIYYVLFSATAFGAADPGSWYLFFGAAAAAYYAASGATRQPDVPPSPAAEKAARQLVELSRSLRDASQDWTPACRGWVWMNTWTFLENSRWGRTEAGVLQDSTVRLRGAAYGIQQAGAAVVSAWRWLVPAAGAPVSAAADARACIAASLEPAAVLQAGLP